MSPFVTKVKAATAYKRLPFKHREYVGIAELRKLNPQTGKVPIALFGTDVLFDSSLILRRLDAQQPSPPLIAEDPATAARQYLLEDWSDESLYWYVQALRWSDKNEPRTLAENRKFVPAPLRLFAKPILRRLVGKQPQAQGLGRLPEEMLIAELALRLGNLVTLLARDPFFHADRPSVADFAIYGVSTTGFSGATPEFAEAFASRPALVEWRSRMDAAISG
ncbi:glutathione S-transferase family protein [Sphingorhabdus sp. 109]|uniref:glutathione S-transferase family protein n=1 Tax=Sphingorhabdus sp. 109 TaxID=2653173 RepID=UPI0022A6D575|nr:glutathione S-transferase family protein [Sphingorhabdus sp. 109]